MRENVSTMLFMTKDANILTIDYIIPPSHKKYTKYVPSQWS